MMCKGQEAVAQWDHTKLGDYIHSCDNVSVRVQHLKKVVTSARSADSALRTFAVRVLAARKRNPEAVPRDLVEPLEKIKSGLCSLVPVLKDEGLVHDADTLHQQILQVVISGTFGSRVKAVRVSLFFIEKKLAKIAEELTLQKRKEGKLYAAAKAEEHKRKIAANRGGGTSALAKVLYAAYKSEADWRQENDENVQQ